MEKGLIRVSADMIQQEESFILIIPLSTWFVVYIIYAHEYYTTYIKYF